MGEYVEVTFGRHKGKEGVIVEAKNTFRFGWTYTIRLENGKHIHVCESEIKPRSEPRTIR
ncbi:KOW motif-containing protein [Alicyclobacillus cellulosilyticus]|uniref:KOW motif-containing protein n=1 Tax=Alicyclobacillus cellulosilyticus TaxID=1003997 RepID=UPI003571289A